MSGFFEMIRDRRSIRAYEERPVDPDDLRAILECARAAPSAGGLQAFAIVVIQQEERRRALSRAALDQEHVARAPAVLVFLQDRARSAAKYHKRGELYSIQDATIACSYAQLAASARGLGSCWVGAFHEGAVSRLLELPPGLVPIALLTLGYPDEGPPEASRRPFGELVRWETF
jgi:nitroreductase